MIKNSNINLTVNIQENLPKIRCNFQQIQQVIMNLLSNAKDALNQRYPGYSKNKIISISCCQVKYKTEDYIQLIVEDYGSGISDRIIEKIFDPFFTTKPNHQGTGLGLYISYGIIKDHQGKLKVETKENEYTRFIINLPLVSRVVE